MNKESSFPAKLYRMLADIDQANNGLEQVVSWTEQGTSFIVRNKKSFIADIMPKYFYQLKYNSFARQLNLHGFRKKTQGPDKGSFYHDLFRKGEPQLARLIVRGKGKNDVGPGRPKAERPKDAKFQSSADKRSEVDCAGLQFKCVSEKTDGGSAIASAEVAKQKSSVSAAPNKTAPACGNTATGISMNQVAVFSHHASFAASAHLLSQMANRRRKEKPKTWQQNLSTSTPASPHTLGTFESLITDMHSSTTASLEPDPIRTSNYLFGDTVDPHRRAAFAMMTAPGLDLEPTPLRPGMTISERTTVVGDQILAVPQSSSNLPKGASCGLVSAIPTLPDRNLLLLDDRNNNDDDDDDDDSCGSNLSALFFGNP